MPNASATEPNCSRSSFTATGESTCTRRKNVDVRGLLYCCESRMLQSRSARKPDTACTMPGRSEHDRVRTSSRTSSPCQKLLLTVLLLTVSHLLGALDSGNVELELDLLADEDAALVERDLEGKAPVATVDGRLALEPDAEAAPRVDRGAVELPVDGDRVGLAVDGEITDQRVDVVLHLLDLRTDEGDLRVVGDVEEVGGAQVRIAVGVAGVDAVDVDLDLGPAVLGVLLVEEDLAAVDLERAADGGDHGVLGGKPHAAVRGVDVIGAGDGAGLGCSGFGAHRFLLLNGCDCNCCDYTNPKVFAGASIPGYI